MENVPNRAFSIRFYLAFIQIFIGPTSIFINLNFAGDEYRSVFLSRRDIFTVFYAAPSVAKRCVRICIYDRASEQSIDPKIRR